MGSINIIDAGLDVQAIVDRLIYVERAPIRRMESQTSTFQNKINAYQTFNTKVSTLLDKTNEVLFKGDTVPLLADYAFDDRLEHSVFALLKASSSDEDILTATGTKGTSSGTYSITVSSLAKAKTMAAANFADTTTTNTGTGTLVFTVGTEDPVTVTIDSSNNTLSGVCNAINAADAGVTATIINDGSASPYRLLITSDETGTANSFTVADNLTGGKKLNLTQTVAAADAQFTVKGISITKSSNTVSDVIDGVTFTLKATTTSAVTLTVERDIDSIVTTLKDWVAAYNEINTFINSQFRYDPTTKKAGVLSGDATLRSTQSTIRDNLIQTILNDFTDYRTINQVGLEFSSDGSLTLNETTLRETLGDDFRGVAALLLGDGVASIMVNLRTSLDHITDPLEGPIHSATDALDSSIREINDRIDAYEERLEVRRELLTQEYSRADQALRLLSVLQASLTSQTDSLTSFQ